MAKEEIIGGIRIALSKGQKLEDAMQSFYNAGYNKEDIEQAVNELFSETHQSVQQSQPIPLLQTQKPQQTQQTQVAQQQKTIQPIPQIQKPQQQIYMPIQPQTIATSKPLQQTVQPQQTQKSDSGSLPTLDEIQKRYKSSTPLPAASSTKQIVSNYESKKKMDIVTVMLIFILALLFGVLAAIFIFRKQIVEILNNIL